MSSYRVLSNATVLGLWVSPTVSVKMYHRILQFLTVLTGTLFLEAGQLIPTVTDNAFELGLLASREVGIFFQPASASGDESGQLTFGGIDPSKFVGNLQRL
jgi:hypothetical protein